MKTLPLLSLLAAGSAALFGLSFMTEKAEAQPIEATATASSSLIVAELFTSQSCSSCPPAEALFSRLAERDDLLTIEWHVDYWDRLVYGSHGSHKDPFSDKQNTIRQQSYNQADLDGRTGVYTPQMVINGRYATVGSNESIVKQGIDVLDRPFIDLTVAHDSSRDSNTGHTGLRIELSGEHNQIPANTHLWMAVFDIEKTTEIPTGENHDKTLTSHHIVREFNQLTRQSGFTDLLVADNTLALNHQVKLKDGQGCAVLMQEASLGTIYGAAYCPDEIWKP